MIKNCKIFEFKNFNFGRYCEDLKNFVLISISKIKSKKLIFFDPLKFQNVNYVRSKNISFKYKSFTGFQVYRD